MYPPKWKHGKLEIGEAFLKLLRGQLQGLNNQFSHFSKQTTTGKKTQQQIKTSAG